MQALSSKGTGPAVNPADVDSSRNYRQTRQFHIGCYNCEGFLSAAAYIADLMRELDVLFLSETWISGAERSLLSDVLCSFGVDDVQIFQTFAMEMPPGVSEGRRYGGTAMVCRGDSYLTFSQLQSECDRLLAVQINSSRSPCLIIAGCYMPYFCRNEDQLESYRDVCASIEELLCVHRSIAPLTILGDFNCALPRLSPAERPYCWARLRGFNAFSREFQQLLDDNDMIVAEFCFPQLLDFTYERGGHRTHIDHIAVPRSFAGNQLQSCAIVPPSADNLSPHLPLRCTLEVAITCQSNGRSMGHNALQSNRTVLDWKSDSRIDAYRMILAERLQSVKLLNPDPEHLDRQLTSCIHEAAAEAGCSRPRRPPKPWWTPSVSAARDRARLWHRMWNDAGRPRNTVLHNCFRSSRRAYRRARIDAARSQVDSIARLLPVLRRNKNVKSFWRRVDLARRGSHVPCSSLTANDFRVHFHRIHTDNETLSTEQQELRARVAALVAQAQVNPGPIRVVSADEVAGLISRLNRNAAPGLDGITVEHLLYGSSRVLHESIASLLTACLTEMRVPDSFTCSAVVPIIKKRGLDSDCADNYRPISLVSTLSKLLELVLLEEISGSFRPSGLQFGFLGHRGTREASMLLHETAQHFLSHQLPLFVANLDARKCFDRLWHSAVLLRANEHLSARSWSLLARWYAHLTARVRFGGSWSDDFSVRRGVRQGALLSPCLTNMFFLPLIQQLDVTCLGPVLFGHHIPLVAYADDMLLMSGNTGDLQKMLDLVTSFAMKWRVDFVNPSHSMTKSHSFIFGAQWLSQIPRWHLCGQTLQYKLKSEHLGVQLNSQLSGTDHVAERVRRGRGAFFGLSPAGMFSPHLPAADKAFLWRAVVSPTMLYGCSICLLSSADITHLEQWEATALKAALRLPRSAHHSALMRALNLPHAQELLRRSQFHALRDAFGGDHRLRDVLLSALARIFLNMGCTKHSGSIVNHVLALCDGRLGRLLSIAGGHVLPDWVASPRPACGLADSLTWLMAQNDACAWGLVRLLTFGAYVG